MYVILGFFVGLIVGGTVAGIIGWHMRDEYVKSRNICLHLNWDKWISKEQEFSYTPNPFRPERRNNYIKYWQERTCKDCGVVETKKAGPLD